MAKRRKSDLKSPAGEWAVKLAELLQSGRDPSEIAARTLQAMRNDELYVFTHPQMSWEVEERITAIQAALAKA